MSLFLLSLYHTCPLLTLRDSFLRDNCIVTTLGELNSTVPISHHTSPLFSLTLYHQWESQSGPPSATRASTLAPGRQAGWALLMPGFSGTHVKWAACASLQTVSPVKYCDSLVNSTACCVGNPGIAKATNNHSIYNCLLLFM